MVNIHTNAFGEAWNYHVHISNSLDFIDIETLNRGIKCIEQRIQEIDRLQFFKDGESSNQINLFKTIVS